MPGSRLNTKNRVSLKIAVLKIVMHAAVVPLQFFFWPKAKKLLGGGRARKGWRWTLWGNAMSIVFPLNPAPTINSFVGLGKTLSDLEYTLGTFILTYTQLLDTPSAVFVNRLPLPAKLIRTVPELSPTELYIT
jgi:hypothetical protein